MRGGGRRVSRRVSWKISRRVAACLFLLPLVLTACGPSWRSGALQDTQGGSSRTEARERVSAESPADALGDDADFERAAALHTAPAYNAYLDKRPTGKYARRARILSERISYYDAISRMKADELQAYLQKYPKGRFASSAQERLQRAEFKLTKKKGTIAAYRAFIARHRKAKSEWTASVTQLLERLLLDRALASGNELTLSRYIHDNPETPYLAEAGEALREAVFDRVMTQKNIDDAREFLRRFKGTSEARIVARHIEEETLRSAERSGSSTALERYLARYPGTPYKERILASLSLMRKERSRDASRWVKIRNAEIEVHRPSRCRSCKAVLRIRGTLLNIDTDFAYDLVLEAVLIEKGKRCCGTTYRVNWLAPGVRRPCSFTIRGRSPAGEQDRPPPLFELRLKKWSSHRSQPRGEKKEPPEIQTSGERAPVDSFKPVPVPPLGR